MVVEHVAQVIVERGEAQTQWNRPMPATRLRSGLRQHPIAQLAARFDRAPGIDESLSPFAVRLLDAAASPWVWLGIGTCSYFALR